MKHDRNLIKSEKQHLKNQAMRIYKSWKVCNNEKRKRFLAEQFNKIAEMYMEHTRE